MKSCNMSITICNENWHLDLVTTAMFYIPRTISVPHARDDLSHWKEDLSENGQGVGDLAEMI